MTDKSPSFLSSVQGVLTALTGVIAAITAFYIAINGDDATIDNDKTPPVQIAVAPPAPQTPIAIVSPPATANATPLTTQKQPIQNTLQAPAQGAGQGTVQVHTPPQPVADPIPVVIPSDALPTASPEPFAQTPARFSRTGALVDCALFPTVNTVVSLMSWSDYYHKQVIVADGIKARAKDACDKTIDYRGMAHCKAPDDLKVREALLETLTLCRTAGIEWTEIKHSTIIEK